MSKTPGLPPIGKSQSARESAEKEEIDNPFKLPSDDKIFRMREEEKLRKEAERENRSHMKIWQKSKTEVMSRSGRLQDLVGESRIATLNDVAAKTDADGKIIVHRRQEKENMTEFIAKKREMFLVQMSLDTKREEIRKLEEKAQMKEEALQRSEQMLEEDAMRFDAFLKENDKKAHDAIKRAEEETKRKQEKMQEIKKLTQQIQALNSEMSKHREALEDCLRYKAFLDMLTPPEWFETHRRAEEERLLKIRKENFERKLKEWEALKKKLVEQHRKETESKNAARDRRHKKEADEEDEPESKLSLPPPPKFEDEPVELPSAEPPMFFTDPQQLMDIFSALEEQNLFLIQNSQETEHTLEELQHTFKQTKLTMDIQSGQLDEQISDLQSQILVEKQRARVLQQKRAAAAEATSLADVQTAPQSQQEKERLLQELNAKVRFVYEQCGFDASSKPNTLFMLSQLESKLESLLIEIERMPAEYVIKAEKEKEKKRRERKREEQQALQVRIQEERNKRAIERSMQAPKKRLGRMVMFRSKPVRKETQNIGDDSNDKDKNMDELKFLS